MDIIHNDRVTVKEMKVYHWHNKQEGKDAYTQFAKEWEIGVKHLRYLLDPAAVERARGKDPGPAPTNAKARREWREDMKAYESRVAKIEEHFTAALSALESSFAFATPPRHIIDNAIETPPADIPVEEWTFERKFRAAWEALRVEYQPSTAVDLSQLRDQIFALNDMIPGGFDAFKSEFHRLHAEIMATRIPNAITTRELNGIVRDGIKNPVVWGFIGHNIYTGSNGNVDAPWQDTFEAISRFLTSFRQKGTDPYGEAQGGLMIGNIPVAANSVLALSAETRNSGQKRKSHPTRETTGRFQKSPKTSASEAYSQGKHQSSNHSNSTSKRDSVIPNTDRKCTRCWQATNHSYRDCIEPKCFCGSSLGQGQPICYNYDNHPPNAKFPEDRMPKILQKVLDAYHRGKGTAATAITCINPSSSKPTGSTARSKSKRNVKAMAASVVEELIRRGISGENLDRSA